MQLYVCSICCSKMYLIHFCYSRMKCVYAIFIWYFVQICILYKYAFASCSFIKVYTWFQMCLYSLQICIVFSSLKLTLWEFEKLKRNRSTAFSWFCCSRLLIVRFIFYFFFLFFFLRYTNLIDIEDRLIFERRIWLRIIPCLPVSL